MTDARHGAAISPNAFYLLFACLVLGAGLVFLDHPPGIVTFAFVAVAWVVSVVIHEFGHAFVAHLAGDTSIEGKGYLTLDPLLYTNLTTTILMPLLFLAMGGIGFPGAAVYLREDLMRTRMGRSMASLAGPGGTLAVLLTLSLILFVMGRAGWTGKALYPALAFLAYLQATALVLNLIPVPGLDGYGVVRPFLPDGVRKALRPVEPIAFLAVFAAIFLVPQVGQGLFDIAGLVAYVLGVPLDAAQAGMDAFRFWKH